MSVVSAGQRFMTDLLVSSLMAGGGLETALDMAFRKETLQVDDDKVGDCSRRSCFINDITL